MLRPLLISLLIGLAPLVAHADTRTEEIVRIHIAAIGGQERIRALSAVRATGRLTEGDTTIRFTMIAQRPNRLRMEYRYSTGTLTEATDGTHRPWRLDTREPNAHVVPLEDLEAQAFTGDADFDDPLVSADRHLTVEYAGEAKVDGQTLIRLLVTRHLSSSFFLFLDPQTYFIVRRIDPKPAVGLDRTEVITDYGEFLPVNGVLTAHQTTITENGRVIQKAVIDFFEANPKLTADTFSAPTP